MFASERKRPLDEEIFQIPSSVQDAEEVHVRSLNPEGNTVRRDGHLAVIENPKVSQLRNDPAAPRVALQ